MMGYEEVIMKKRLVFSMLTTTFADDGSNNYLENSDQLVQLV